MATSLATPVSLSAPEIQMLRLHDRLKSFEKWKAGPVCVQDLAEAGYYATGQILQCVIEDIVRCFHCGNYAADWKDQCDPLIEHKRLSPNCEFSELKLEQIRRKARAEQKAAYSKKKKATVAKAMKRKSVRTQ